MIDVQTEQVEVSDILDIDEGDAPWSKRPCLTSRPESTSKRPDRPKASSGPCNHVGSADLAPVGVRSRALVNRVIQAPWEEVSTGGVGNCSRSSARWSATCREATVRSSGEPSPMHRGSDPNPIR